MRHRCLGPTHEAFYRYGGVGITICKRWETFANFLADMGPRPIGMSLDRWPDPSGNYEPGNCRWATAKQQAENRRTRHSVRKLYEKIRAGNTAA